MTSRPRLRLAGIATTLALAGAGLAGWALTTDDGARAPRPVAAVHGATTTTAVAAPTTTAPPAAGGLPVPEDSPADPYAPAPVVVHGTLELPSVGVAQPLHEGVTLTAINRGPSHWPGSAMPGQLGNVVVAGHRTTYTQPFHDLDRLAPGDPLVFRMTDGSVWTYELTSTEIVGPDAMHIVDQAPEHTATLFACHPKGSAAQRIVAHFRLAGGGA
ncbi:MAG TPA: class E sortase [Acidimicrobiales bacterium]